MKPVLGEDELKSNGYINLKYDKNNYNSVVLLKLSIFNFQLSIFKQ